MSLGAGFTDYHAKRTNRRPPLLDLDLLPAQRTHPFGHRILEEWTFLIPSYLFDFIDFRFARALMLAGEHARAVEVLDAIIRRDP